MFRWKRTNFEGFPRVYLRFKAKDSDSDELVEYRIQDLPEEKFKDAIDFYTGDQFLRDEQFTKGTGNRIKFQSKIICSFKTLNRGQRRSRSS